MTKAEFVDKFFIEYDKISSLGSPGYELNELSNLVSEAQESLIIKKYGPQSNRLKEGFEETEKRVQEIGELVDYKTITSFSTGFFDNAVYAELPNTLLTSGPTDFSDVYWFTIYEDCTSDVLDCTIANNTTIFVKPDIIDVGHEFLRNSLNNPFRKPFIRGNQGRVLRLRSIDRKHQLITDGTFNITAYNIGYIKKPQPIDLSINTSDQVSELSDSFHRELLHETVELAKTYVQDQSVNLDRLINKE